MTLPSSVLMRVTSGQKLEACLGNKLRFCLKMKSKELLKISHGACRKTYTRMFTHHDRADAGEQQPTCHSERPGFHLQPPSERWRKHSRPGKCPQ